MADDRRKPNPRPADPVRDLLARLYPGRDEARRVVADAGLSDARINFDGDPTTRWFQILQEANKTGAVAALVAIARTEYPDAVANSGIDQSKQRRKSKARKPASGKSNARKPTSPSSPTQPATPVDPDAAFDVFLSHNSKDKPAVRDLADKLTARGLKPWLDKRELIPGRLWQEALEDIIATARTAAVLVGKDGLGPWEKTEMRGCLSEFVDRGMPVIPVLLPGAPKKPKLPLFLRGFAWVNLRRGLTDEGLDDLEWGIRGEKPGTKKPTPAPPEPTVPPATIAILGVRSEVGDALDAVAARLRSAPATTLRALDAADPTSTAALDAVDLTVVLLGGATGGTDVLQIAIDRQPAPVILRLQSPDLDAIDLDELRFTRDLRLRAKDADAPEFTTPTEAAELALDATLAWLRQRTPTEAGHSPMLESWERTYLQVRLPDWQRGRYGPFVARAQDLSLEQDQLYVSLRATTDVIWESNDQITIVPPSQRSNRANLAPDGEREREERTAVHLERALSQSDLPHLVIEGEAGSGKTVLLQHTAMVLATLHTGGTPPAHALDLDALTGKRPLPPIPVLVEARKIATCLEQANGIGGLQKAVLDELEAASGAKLTIESVRAGFEAGRYLLLIDSLDETPGEDARLRVVRTLEGYALAGLPSRLVLTTRPSAYLGRVTFGPPLRTVRVAPLAEAEATALIDRWCAAQAWNAAYRGRLLTVIGALRERHDANLGENPMLLTCTLLVYAKQERLPDATADLYEELVDVLCQKRSGTARPAERRQTLEIVCLALQEAGGTQLTLDAAAQALQDARLANYPIRDMARTALDHLAEETGLLRFRRARDANGKPVVLLEPWHRSFQEFLAACRLASGVESVTDATRKLFEPRNGGPPVVDDPAWEGVLRFLVGVHGQQQVERAHAYIEELHRTAAGSAHEGRLLGLVATGLTEYREHFANHALVASLPNEIVAAFRAAGANWPLADRLLALEALGRLGDPRLDEDPWIDIPAGSFEMGDGVSYNSAPRMRVRVNTFRIASRPVTVVDFAPFVTEAYADSKAWWSAGRHQLDDTAPRHWERQLHHPNRPITGISWYAAMAYCRWATADAERWPHQPGWKIDLPTEAEWEYVARGKTGSVYPWGDERLDPGRGDSARANHRFDGSPGHPTPVGAFPKGNRKQLVDLAGNVDEWCLDGWRTADDKGWRQEGEVPRIGVEEPVQSQRVVRGGSWSDPPWFLRASYRLGFSPWTRSSYLGFRVVCRRISDGDR